MTRKQRRILTFLAITLPICIGASIGWSYLWQRPCSEVTILGAEYTDPDEIHKLIHDTFSPPLVVDRIQRHPWVREVRAVCYPSGTVRVEVMERQPHLLILTTTGKPAYYLDEFGYMMPTHTQMIFDVPLLRASMIPYRALLPVNNQALRDLLTMLPRLPAEIDSLVSEFELTEDSLSMTMRFPRADQITVIHLGSTAWEERLQKLYAFWEQRIRSHESRKIEVIDLRFQGQIVTIENPI